LLINTWKIIKKSSPECTAQPKLFRENEIPKTEVVKQLESLLSKLLEIKSCSFPAENYDEDKLIDIVIKITNEIGLWNRALLGKYDLKFLRAHYLKGEESYKPHNHITFYDIKKSTYILNLLDKNISSPVFNDYQRWFKQITSTPKNWSILFGGKISPKEENAGDKLSAYFSSFWSCIYSVAFSMCHLSMLDTISNDPFRFRVRSGIGEGNVYFSAEQEHCLTINHLAHAIEKIADLDTKYEPNEPYCLAIENYLKDHQQLERFLNKKDLKVEFKEGVAVPIRLNKLVEKFINEFKELK